jgi:MFS family permease
MPAAAAAVAPELDSRFRRLMVAAGISNLGDGLYQTALPLLVASITRDPLLVAGTTAASQLPWLLFALISGVLVDRVDRRVAMIVADAFRTLVVAALGIAVIAGAPLIWLIYLAGFLLATAETVFDPASEAILPQIVGRRHLAAANSRLQGLTWVANSFVGPPLGAALFGLVAGLPFLVDAASFLLAAALVGSIPGRYVATRASGAEATLRREVTAGVRFIARHPVLRWTTPMAGMTNMAGVAIVAVFVLYVQDVLGLDALGYGVLISVFGLGGLIGALTAGRINGQLGPSATIRATLLIGVVSAGSLIVLTHPVAAALAAGAFGFQITLWNVTVVSLRQELVPDEMRGRIAGASRLVTFGAQPIGAFAGGALAAAFGLLAPFVFAILVIGTAAAIAFVALTPQAIADARQGGGQSGSRPGAPG